MACAAPDIDETDEFEQYRARAYSAGAAMLERGAYGGSGKKKAVPQRKGSRKGRRGSAEVENSLVERVSEMDISEDSGYGLSAEEGSRPDMFRQRLERNRSFKRSPQAQRHFRSLSCRRPTRPRELDLSETTPRMRTFSMPARGQLKRPDMAKLRASYQRRNLGEDYEFYRVRSFTTTPKGIINRGDSVKVRHSSSQASLDSTGSGGPERFRGRTSSNASQESDATFSPPSPPEQTPIYNVLMLGSQGTGKTALTHQFMTSEYVGQEEDTSLDEGVQQAVTVKIDDQSSTLCFIDLCATDDPSQVLRSHRHLDAYVVVYSVADRESFDDAVEILHELKKDKTQDEAVVLVANKTDIVRNRDIREQEGKQMAVRYDCKYIEVSAVLHMKVDELLVGVVRQIKLKRDNKSRRKNTCMSADKNCINDAAWGLIGKLFKHHPYRYRSCDNLMVL